MALEARLSGIEIPGKVVPAENYHLTLRFLGAVEEVAYERFLAGLDESELGAGFRIGIEGLGAFPNARRATVLWAGVTEGSERLEQMAEVAERAAGAAGLDAEERPFRPHLTLSRMRPQQDVTTLVDGSADVSVRWRCDRVVVFRSHPGPGGVRYEPLETFPLDG